MTDIKLGFVDYSTLVYIPDPASTDGSGKTGLVAADLTVSYTRVETDNDIVVTDVTSSLNDLAALTTAHTDWGLKEVSNTLAPGLYRLDIADAVFASGAWSAVVYAMITTSAAAASPMQFDLVAFDRLDGVRFGLTALPNAAADAAGGLIISDAGGLDADAQRVDVAAILVDTAEIGAAGAGLTNINLPNQIMDIVGNITGNLSGSVGSVTGLTASNLDATISSRATQVSVDDLPTNAELATALGTADDAVLAQMALVKAVTDKLDDTLEDDAGTYRFTANALEEAPTGAAPTANQNADALLDRADAIEVGLTPRQAMRISAAADGGKLSGGATTTNTIRNAVADSKNRITATVDADGNRSAIVYDLT